MMLLEKKILQANILIVDDQMLNVRLLEKILKQAGYQHVYSTLDSRQAVAMYQEHDIDILLLDIRMPHFDGFQVMQQLNDELSSDYLPILVLTAEPTPETRSQALSSGAKDFLIKPFDRSEALLRIRNILEVRLLHKQVKEQNEHLEEQVKERTKQLEDSRRDVIQRLGLAAEYKDNETGNHVLRMSKFSQLLALEVGMSEREANVILDAAPMHDVGKIGIPDNVLLKPGRLDADEMIIMQTHVTIGAEILSGGESELMKMAKSIALSHHEKWDGTGYPMGLSGEDIPIEGRICALCDVFDALMSERPYKKAWSIDKTMALIKEQSGQHFDPALVTAFEGILDEVLVYRGYHMDGLLSTDDEDAS